ncbi:M15 family metallopeptidase [Achromobacter xylosoxidans]
MLLLLPLYFLLAIGVSALLVFPSFRAGTARGARAFAQGIRRRVARRGAGGRRGGRLGASGARRRRQGRQHVFGVPLADRRGARGGAASVLFAFVMRHNHTFIYEDRMAGPDPRIQALLTGERLVPPPPLPPEVFTTREVELVRPNLGGASRDWNLLDADYRQRLLAAYRVMREEHGYEMVLIEGYRSPERQEELASKGSHVTNAGAYQSYHQYGLAADSAFLRDGKVVVSEKDPWAMRGYELFGETAERVGLTWGGRWKLMDFGHTELRRPGVMRRDTGAAQ